MVLGPKTLKVYTYATNKKIKKGRFEKNDEALKDNGMVYKIN